jgi:hypothetical protein
LKRVLFSANSALVTGILVDISDIKTYPFFTIIIQRGIIVAIKVIDVPGIGPKTAEYLIAEGLETAEDLVNAGIGQLMQAPGFHLNRATSVLEGARALIADTDAEASASGKNVRKVLIPETGKENKTRKKKKGKKEKKDKDKGVKKKKDKKDKKSKKKKKKS